MDCPFCQQLVSGDVTDANAHAVAFADGYPVAAGHTLVVPRRHVASVFDLSAEEYAALWEVVGAVRRARATWATRAAACAGCCRSGRGTGTAAVSR